MSDLLQTIKRQISLVLKTEGINTPFQERNLNPVHHHQTPGERHKKRVACHINPGGL